MQKQPGDVDTEVVHYCERFLELVIDLEALLPTRRFFNVVMDHCHLVTRCHLSKLNQRPEGKLFSQVSHKNNSFFTINYHIQLVVWALVSGVFY